MLVAAGQAAAQDLVRGLDVLLTEREGWEFESATAQDALAEHFAVRSLEGFGIGEGDAPAVGAAGALMRYLRELLPAGVPHLARPVVERPGGVMPIDEMTRRNLELVESLRGGDTAGTLLGVLDRTQTPMGARLLRQWVLAPLTDLAAINARLDAVDALVHDPIARAALRTALDGVRDVERLAGKTAALRANPRDVRALGDSLARLPQVEAALQRMRVAGALAAIQESWDSCGDLAAEIQRSLVERPPVVDRRERDDRARRRRRARRTARDRDGRQGRDRVAAGGGARAHGHRLAEGRLQQGVRILHRSHEREQPSRARGLPAPADADRRRAVRDAGAERVRGEGAARDGAHRRCSSASCSTRCARASARRSRGCSAWPGRSRSSTCSATLAEVASREGYVRPEVGEGFDLDITAGRHPVVERMMPREQFIPNDVRLAADARMIILTGPNMAGKSTILRQIGLIVLMAQMGSFVPATRARVGIADRVFTRVGASDNLVRGQSTFMVEMSETSAILHTATARSLVLLDEIGRGTST